MTDKSMDGDGRDIVPKLTLPAGVVEAVRIAQRLRRSVDWAGRIAAHTSPVGPIVFSRSLFQRFDIRHAPGSSAVNFARRLVPDPLEVAEVELTVSPYAPPMRQLASVRQGVPMWSASESHSTPRVQPQAASRPAAPASRPTPAAATGARRAKQKQEDKNKIPDDLIAILNMHRALGHISD